MFPGVDLVRLHLVDNYCTINQRTSVAFPYNRWKG
ncbi:hypothetical protein RSAG8_09267, partial [Rhizoctonia solani AG-8 WAC10335]